MTARWHWIDLLLAFALAWGGWAFLAQVNAAASRELIFETERPAPEIPASATRTMASPVRVGDYASVWGRLFGPRIQAPDSQPPPLVPYTNASSELPLLFGIADLGEGPTALLAPGAGQRARWTAPGQDVGGYRLQSISRTKLVFTRNGERFEASPTELRDPRRRAAAARPLQAAASRPAAGTRESVAPARQPASGSGRFRIGAEFRPGRFAADAGDGATDGVEFGGYVRRVRHTPFGSQHWWERADEQGAGRADP